MKATIDVPDDIYRKVKAKSALLGRPIREVTVELYERWLAEEPPGPAYAAQDWLSTWLDLADRSMPPQAGERSAREELEADRNRLESR